jgi:hypothetical protein
MDTLKCRPIQSPNPIDAKFLYTQTPCSPINNMSHLNESILLTSNIKFNLDLLNELLLPRRKQ